MKSLLAQAMTEAWQRLPAEARVFCAVSGGLDSMALLEAAAQYRRDQDPGRKLIVLHVNHGLRGEESDGDEALVRKAARRLGLPLESCRLEWKGERPSQDACRKKREGFYASLLGPKDRLLLAHHLDDQAETVLLRLIRGSGVRGLGGMRVESGRKLRPFLNLSRSEIREFAEEAELEWREDSSNLSLKYERNWLRHEILPLLEARRPGVAVRLAALAGEAAALAPPPLTFSSFSLSEDWAFYRGEELERASPANLSEAFHLSRLHTRALAELLRKKSGRHTAEGVGFHLSGGILLAQKKPFLPESGLCPEAGLFKMRNALGEWELPLFPGERAGPAGVLRLGEKAKKEFQRHEVPVFFRGLVPLLVRRGKPSALLPATAPENVRIQLNPLGRWWLKAKS